MFAVDAISERSIANQGIVETGAASAIFSFDQTATGVGTFAATLELSGTSSKTSAAAGIMVGDAVMSTQFDMTASEQVVRTTAATKSFNLTATAAAAMTNCLEGPPRPRSSMTPTAGLTASGESDQSGNFTATQNAVTIYSGVASQSFDFTATKNAVRVRPSAEG